MTKNLTQAEADADLEASLSKRRAEQQASALKFAERVFREQVEQYAKARKWSAEYGAGICDATLVSATDDEAGFAYLDADGALVIEADERA